MDERETRKLLEWFKKAYPNYPEWLMREMVLVRRIQVGWEQQRQVGREIHHANMKRPVQAEIEELQAIQSATQSGQDFETPLPAVLPEVPVHGLRDDSEAAIANEDSSGRDSWAERARSFMKKSEAPIVDYHPAGKSEWAERARSYLEGSEAAVADKVPAGRRDWAQRARRFLEQS